MDVTLMNDGVSCVDTLITVSWKLINQSFYYMLHPCNSCVDHGQVRTAFVGSC